VKAGRLELIANISGPAVILDRADIDTDQILPKQFLRRVDSTGFGPLLFYDWRFDERGLPRPDAPLDERELAEASVLVTGPNFGCGSAREQAVWALQQAGFRVLIAPSFADIFLSNCMQNSLVCITVTPAALRRIIDSLNSPSARHLVVDLKKCMVRSPSGQAVRFFVDEAFRVALVSGCDAWSQTVELQHLISEFERKRPSPVNTKSLLPLIARGVDRVRPSPSKQRQRP
jgi:3-isopropylmalate/(R)-2-methylmalate dehydratase small subunit